ncbi:MAG: hypothetical protein ACE5GD_00925 [Candidatus Geothermarchaeales archaeon]
MKIRITLNALLVLILIVVFIILTFPLIQTVTDEKAISRSYDWEHYWVSSLSPSSHLNAKIVNSTVILGDDASEGDSWVTYRYFFPPASFLSHTIKKEGLDSRLELIIDAPLSSATPWLTPTKVGWRGNLSAIPWRVGGGEPLMEFNGGRLDLSANFTLGEKSTYLWWTPEGSLEIDSTEYPYVVARWRSTGHVARLCVYTATEEFKIIVETPTGVIEHPAWDYGGGYSPSWTTTVYRLPPNKTITRMDIGLDSGRWGDVDGEQHVEFDYIMFAQGTLDAPHVKVALNGETIFDERLTYKSRRDGSPVSNQSLYTWNPSVLWPIGKMVFPVEKSLSTENIINCSVGRKTQWRIHSASIITKVNWKTTKSIVEMAPYQALIAFFGLFLVVLIGVYKMFFWVLSADSDQGHLAKAEAKK